MKKRTLAALGLSGFAGLALLIQPGAATTAFANQNAGQTDAATQAMQGRIVNMPGDRDCSEVGGISVCAYEAKGIAVSDEGELIQRSFFGTSHREGGVPHAASENASYAIWTFGDGSTMLLQSEGGGKTEATGQRVGAGTQHCIAGTGRFADVDCTINWRHSPHDSGLRMGSFDGTVTPKAQS